MVSTSVRSGLVVLVAAVVTLVLRLARGFYWSHALIVGLAVGALVYSSWRTFDRWRR